MATDTTAQITLAALPLRLTIWLDGALSDPTVTVPPGRHRITLSTTK
ncbi:MAG TPA: hypothetical protein VEF72_07155 [Mycobacterium sp.]|nr:hypothetical protein [Mycobacterium sp.]